MKGIYKARKKIKPHNARQVGAGFSRLPTLFGTSGAVWLRQSYPCWQGYAGKEEYMAEAFTKDEVSAAYTDILNAGILAEVGSRINDLITNEANTIFAIIKDLLDKPGRIVGTLQTGSKRFFAPLWEGRD